MNMQVGPTLIYLGIEYGELLALDNLGYLPAGLPRPYFIGSDPIPALISIMYTSDKGHLV
jgi:hypothetical protein